MKLFVLMTIFAIGANASDVQHVLIIGNSYVASNNLSDMVAKLATQQQGPVDIAQVAHGGWTLKQHANSKKTLELIASRKWLAIILQEQSTIPAQENRRQPFIEAIHGLKKAAQPNTTFYLMATWGRERGLPSLGFKEFQSMQKALNTGYQLAAAATKSQVIPAGTVWQAAYQEGIKDLWMPDGSHPSRKGSYLVACSIVRTIWQIETSGLPNEGTLSKEECLALQGIVDRVI